MIRAFILASLPFWLAFSLGASCQHDPVTPDNTGGTGGVVGTGGVPTTGGVGGAAPSEAELVCSHLRAIGCADGYNPECVERIQFYQRDDRFSFDTGCLLLSTDVAMARRCGSVTCGGTQ